ncbi:toll/interleukin-1 receptor domain-containing protein [Streptomyces sp. F63]|uniref:toll/interleukin-1 receptor domain-containing protein n=1 Tax=Streptomyces sp. F63 TaxID=2824887 RepID=UPI001B372217|nr:toll/interleukin-1 receptor domain-containing protein [Streptomyces sp. F63]MBQ0985976.1 toll/interleukin-1 receptor domain-containing protein [Streptomyces sp. F63]
MTDTRFDAFLSYSKQGNEPLAQALHRGLHRLAKPWYQLRAVQVFRDAHDLSASASLKGSIKDALLASEHFLLVASPASARSRWVREEMALWRRHKPAAQVLLVLAGGELRWNPEDGDFDWAATTALPRAEVEGWFTEEPLWVDMREFAADELRMRNAEFQDAVATLAAPLRGCTKSELVSEDLRLHRRAVRVRRSLLAGLAVLSVLAASAAVVALKQRDEAQAQARRALSRALGAASQDRMDDDPRLAVRLGLYAYAADATPEAKSQLMRLIQANSRITAFVRDAYQQFPGRGEIGGATVKNLTLSPDGRRAALLHQGTNDVLVWDTQRRRRIVALPSDVGHTGGRLTGSAVFDASGRTLTVSDPTTRRTAEYELPSGRLRTSGRAPAGGADEESPAASTPDLPKRCALPEQDKDGTAWRPVGFSSRTDRLATVCDGGELRLFDTRTGRSLGSRRLDADVGWTAVAVSGDGKWIAAGNSDGDVIGLPADLSVAFPLGRHSNSVADIEIDTDGSVVLSSGDTGDVVQASLLRSARLTDLAAGITATDAVPASRDTSLLASPDGSRLLVRQSGGVEMWDTRRHTRLAAYRRAAQDMSFSGDGGRFSLLADGTVTVRETDSLKPVTERSAGDGPVTAARALTAATGGFRVVTGLDLFGDGNGGGVSALVVWADGERVLSRGPVVPVTAVNGSYFAVAERARGQTRGGAVTVWRHDGDDAPERVWETPTQRAVSQLAVSANGEYVVVGDTADQGEVIRRSAPGRSLPLEGGNTVSGMSAFEILHEQGVVVQHTDSIRQGANAEQRHNQLLLWDLSTGGLLGSWPEPQASGARTQPTHLALTSGGTRVATLRPNGHVGLWNVSPENWRATLCGLSGGDLSAGQAARYLDGIEVPDPCPG